MMPGCSSYEGGHVMGACSCGMFHSQTNSFPMLFGNSTNQYNPYDDHEYSDMYNSFTPSSSSVDCTLSLGTPSTRLTEDEEKRTSSSRSLCWDLLRSKHSHTNKSTRGSSSSSSSSNNDPLLARRCANCDTTSTPLWRNGPRGPKSLCNACGIRYKKEERRAAAAASTATASASGGVMESAGMYGGGGGHHTNYWYAQSHDGDGESENGIPFLSWRLNVTDNRGLVHDFTR